MTQIFKSIFELDRKLQGFSFCFFWSLFFVTVFFCNHLFFRFFSVSFSLFFLIKVFSAFWIYFRKQKGADYVGSSIYVMELSLLMATEGQLVSCMIQGSPFQIVFSRPEFVHYFLVNFFIYLTLFLNLDDCFEERR
jgi:hypothetical protein